MDPYTKVNLRTDAEDLAPKFGLGSHLEFRMAREALAGDQSALSFLRIAPNYRLPFGHRQQEEVYVVVGGSARIKLDEDVLELGPWDAVRIARDTVRNLEAGPEGAELRPVRRAQQRATGRRDAPGVGGPKSERSESTA